MAIYEFQCRKCQTKFTAEQSFRDFDQRRKVHCTRCGSTAVARIVSSVHVQTKKKS